MKEVWIVTEYYFDDNWHSRAFSSKEKADNFITSSGNKYIEEEVLNGNYSKEDAIECVDEVYTWIVNKRIVN